MKNLLLAIPIVPFEAIRSLGSDITAAWQVYAHKYAARQPHGLRSELEEAFGYIQPGDMVLGGDGFVRLRSDWEPKEQ